MTRKFLCFLCFIMILPAFAQEDLWDRATVISGDETNGFAKVTLDNGKILEGYFENRIPHGYAKLSSTNSEAIHLGEYVKGKKSGVWITTANGVINSVSEYEDGKAVGSRFSVLVGGAITLCKPMNIEELFENDSEEDGAVVLLPTGRLDGDFLYEITPNVNTNFASGIYVPEDLEECFTELHKLLTPELLECIRDGTSEDLIFYEYHSGLGRWLRNNWGLWGDSRLSRWFNERGVLHPDYMSSIIYTSFVRHLRNESIELDAQIKAVIENQNEDAEL